MDEAASSRRTINSHHKSAIRCRPQNDRNLHLRWRHAVNTDEFGS